MLNDRLTLIGDYPFRRLAQLLAELPAPADPLSLAVGEPQLAPPDLVAETLTRHADLWNKYPPAAGTAAWRTAVAGFLHRRYAISSALIDPERGIVPAPGSREALFLIAQAVVPTARHGERPVVLIPDPFYQVYLGAAALAGAEPVFVPATAESGFLPDLDGLDRATLARTALLYLCSPANPQGVIASLDYLKRALTLARHYGFVLAVDECYSEIWDRAPPPGALEAAQAMGGVENLVVFNSLSKRSSAAGLRSGFVAGDSRIVGALLRVMEYGGAGMGLPIQAAAAELWRDDAHVAQVRDFYRQNIDIAEHILGNRFGFYRPPGGFFLWLDVGDGEAAARRLWAEAGLRVLPGAYLARGGAEGNPGARYIRVALVQPADRTEAGLNRLADTLPEPCP